jgi:hypothetical protein
MSNAPDLPRTKVEAMRLDYVDRAIKIIEICKRHDVSRRRLYLIAVAEGWPLRSPKRVDKHDLTQRLLRLLERQIGKLEQSMKDGTTDKSAVLGKLSATLDRLIATDRATAPQRRPARESKMIEDIRKKVAERLAQLNGD